MAERLRPPMIYYGGKQRIASKIAALLPQHSHYVETHAGSLSVLLAKDPSPHETVNDLDGDLMCFWRVLRDRPGDLQRVCAATPHSRGELWRARKLSGRLNELERARRVWVLLTQHRTGTFRPQGWRSHVDGSKSSYSMPRYLESYVRRMQPVAERLRQVSLECLPAVEVIERLGTSPSTLLYVDPPYPESVRKGGNYRWEAKTEEEHRELADALRSCAAIVVVSSYPSKLYDRELFADWHRLEIAAGTAQGGRWSDRTEVLWSNRPLGGAEKQGGDQLFRDDGLIQTDERHETVPCRMMCGRGIRWSGVGRRPLYCSTACRSKSYRARTSARGGDRR